MQEKYADHIAILLVMVFLANALLTTLGLSSMHVAWFCFGIVFLGVLMFRADYFRLSRKKRKK